MDQRRPTWLLTVIASAAVHVLALWWLSAPGTSSALPAATPLEMTWFNTEVARPAPPAPAPTPTPERLKRPVAETPRGSSRPATTSPSPAASEGTSSSAPSGGGIATVGEVGDVPVGRGINLTPGFGGVLKMNGAPDAEGPRGTTVRNGPGEEPDHVAAKEYEGETLTRRLNGELQQEVGAAAVAVGNVPGHFRSVESSLREALRGTQVDVTPKSAGQVARDVAKMLLLNPGVSAEAARKVTDTPLGRSMASGSVPMPNADDQRFREQAMQMMGAVEALKEKASAPQLRTVLELTSDATGGLADVTVVEKSGDPRFDESVLHLSRKVFRSLPESDEKGLGASWWRTRWQFTWEPPSVKVRLIGAHRIPPV